jgi:hypothetical protein
MDQLPQLEHLTVQQYEEEESQDFAQHQQQGRWQGKNQKGRRQTKTNQARQQLAKKPQAKVSMNSDVAKTTHVSRCAQGINLNKSKK